MSRVGASSLASVAQTGLENSRVFVAQGGRRGVPVRLEPHGAEAVAELLFSPVPARAGAAQLASVRGAKSKVRRADGADASISAGMLGGAGSGVFVFRNRPGTSLKARDACSKCETGTL